MQLTPYLTFDGTCEQALAFYAQALNGEVTMLMRFGDMPEQPDWSTAEIAQRIAHGRVRFDGGQIMASDSAGQPFEGHRGFAMQLGFEDADAAQGVFAALAEGGTIVMPFEPIFWAKRFGLCRDRFGVEWMVQVD